MAQANDVSKADPPKSEEDLHQATIDGVLRIIVEELRHVLHQDVCRYFMEGPFNKIFEKQYDELIEKRKIQLQLEKFKRFDPAEEKKKARTSVLGNCAVFLTLVGLIRGAAIAIQKLGL